MGKYAIVFDMGGALYAKETKIIIDKAVLTKDSETGKVFAQIRMSNLLSKPLIAVKIALTGRDISGAVLEEKTFTYLDIKAGQKEDFGQKTPVHFDDSTVRSFDIKILEAVYADGSKLSGGGENLPVPETDPLSSVLSNAEIEQYRRDNGVKTANGIPCEFSDLWICTCGEINLMDNAKCSSCGASREKLMKTLDKNLLDEEIKEGVYTDALKTHIAGNTESIAKAIGKLKRIKDYKDSKELISRYEAEIAAIEAEEEKAAAVKRKKMKKTAAWLTGIIAACVAVVLLFTQVVIPAIRANNFKKGNYSVGDVVLFGNYHGEIEWLVLDKQDGKALLISKYALDAKPYNEKHTNITWEYCTLRAWLNGAFINAAFSEAEKGLILDANLTNADNAEYGTDGGNDTVDKVFLLSIDEAKKYFPDDVSRRCAPTKYAKEQGAYLSDDYTTASGEAVCWWLRSPGIDQGCATTVNSYGCVNVRGSGINIDYGCVRPALWVRLGE